MGEGASRLSKEAGGRAKRVEGFFSFSVELWESAKKQRTQKERWTQERELQPCRPPALAEGSTVPSPKTKPGSRQPEPPCCTTGIFLRVTSGAACEADLDVCFCVSHIHLHTFYIFIYKGLSMLFSAFLQLKCCSCSPLSLP